MRPPSPRPAVPAGGGWASDIGGTAAIAVVLGLGSASALMWTATQVAALVGTGRFVAVNLPACGRALFAFRNHLRDPAAAWPPDIASQLPGPLVYWPSMLAVAGIASWIAWRLWRWRQARTGGAGPLGIAGAGFAHSHNLDRLAVAAPTKGRLTLGYAGRRLIAAEPQTSLAVVGPTGCGKTAGFAIPALLEWEGPVIATSVKNDLLDPTLERRRQLGKVWIYDPTGKSGHPSHRWTPLSCCASWAGAMRIAAWLCEAAQPKMDSVTDGDYWYTQARKALAPYLYAAAIDGRSMADVVRWVDAQEIDAVEKILRRSGGVDAALDERRASAESQARRDKLRPQIEALLVAAVREGVSALPGGRNARSWQREPVAKWPLAQQEQLAELVEQRLDEKLAEELEQEVVGELQRCGTLDALVAAQSLWCKEDRLRGSVFATIENVLAGYADPGVADASSAAGFTFEEWLSGENTIFVSAPPHEQARLRPVLSVLLQQAVRTAYETANASGGTLQQPCLVLLDEAGNITPLRDLPTYASTARSHGITLVSIWQDLSQMRAVYRQRAQTVLNNHQAKLFGTGQSDDATLDYLSRLVGDERRTEVNLSGDLWGSRRNVSEHTAYRRAAPADTLRPSPRRPGRAHLRQPPTGPPPAAALVPRASRSGPRTPADTSLIDVESGQADALSPRMERSTRDDATSAAPALASELVAACEAAWSSIQRQHPGVPDAVIILGSGVERGRLVKLGHWWSGRWIADGQVRGEVLLAGEALHLKPEDVFEVLLHEAAHGLNAHLGIKDTSRGGRYHNARFRQTAEDFGLRVATAPPFGWASTALTEQATERYRTEITAIGEALRIARRLNNSTTIGVEGATGGESTSENGERETGSKNPPARCGCGRKMRMAPATLVAGPVICGLCNEPFTTTPHRQQQVEQQQETVVDDNADRTFIDRRREALRQSRTLHPSAGLSAPRRERRPNEADGLRILALAAESPEGIASLAAAGAWYHAWHRGLEEPIVGSDVIEVAACNDVARALLKLDHTLTGATVNLAGREWMIGDRVVIGRHSVEQFDADGELIPPTGVPGIVTGVDPSSQCVVIDFPIHGTNRFTDDTLAAAALDYGYAVLATDHGAPQVDLRLLDLAPVGSEGRWPELER